MLAPFPSEFSNVSFVVKQGEYQAVINGEPHKITHAFGVTPLQQYLVRAPDGRLQALNIAWDSRPKSAGGERWFDLYEAEQPQPGEAIHWQGRAHTWNSMCADCHTTSFEKNYSQDSQSFDSTAAEFTVGCEACHGAGSNHVAAPASNPLPLPTQATLTTESCAPCHSRRSQIAEGFTRGSAYLDHYMPSLLHPPLYTADGQIEDEVYVYGSFAASKMSAQGVTCTNCHDPHTAETRIEGDGLCTQCHSAAGNAEFPTLTKKRYDSIDHHFHQENSSAAACVSCHMPSRTYMTVDPRRDHSFRVPRPDLATDVRNPCTTCHEDKSNQWAAEAIAMHHGEQRPASSFAALLTQNESALAQLAERKDAPSMLRATALADLARGRTWHSRQVIEQGLSSEVGIVRIGALRALNRLAPQTRARHLQRAYTDPLLAVRLEAAAQAIALRERPIPVAVVQEYRDAQRLNAETPEAMINLAALAAHNEDWATSEQRLRDALKIEPDYVPGLINLADLLRSTGRDFEGKAHLIRATEISTPTADAFYALGLWYARNQQAELATQSLLSATNLAPSEASFFYGYLLALHGQGETQRALAELETALATRFAQSTQLVYLAATLNRDTGQLSAARHWSQRLVELGDDRGAQLMQALAR